MRNILFLLIVLVFVIIIGCTPKYIEEPVKDIPLTAPPSPVGDSDVAVSDVNTNGLKNDVKTGDKNSLDDRANEVIITSSGFEPNALTINAGEDVKFVNKDSSSHWPASAMHPTHTLYPGSGASKCGTSEEKNIFDACMPLNQDETYTFTFNEKGSWDYHDHLHPSRIGKIIVR